MNFETPYGTFQMFENGDEPVPFFVRDVSLFFLDRYDEYIGKLKGRLYIYPETVNVNATITLRMVETKYRFKLYDYISDEWESGTEYEIENTSIHFGISQFVIDTDWLFEHRVADQWSSNNPIEFGYGTDDVENRTRAAFIIAWGEFDEEFEELISFAGMMERLKLE